MHDFFLNLTTWITSHPNLAGFTIFITSFAESLAFVGLIMPGAAMMLTAGALIATGALSFWPTMGWAVCGAVLADGLSFWIGHRFKDHIRSFSLFARYPEVLTRGEEFFNRHGGKSVFFGRFVGPVRPVIPIVAGMMGMGHTRFTVYNILSALGWAPAYLLPGMAFGASLALAGEVAERLAILLVLLMLLGWLVFSVFRRGVLFLFTHWPVWEKRLINRINKRPVLQRWLGGFFDKDSSLIRPLILLIIIFVAASWLFLGITEDVMTGDPLVRSSKSLYHLLQGFRTPWGDLIMVGMTMLGDAAVTVPLVLAALFWLLLKKDRYSALFLTVTATVGFLLVTGVKQMTKIPRPVDMYGGAVHWAFPSSHATMSLVIFGFLAMLCSREMTVKKRWLPFGLALFLILGIGYSRLYLGAHWLSDVVGGFSLGTAWLILMTVAFLHGKRACRSQGLFRFSLILFILAAAVHWSSGFTMNMLRYQQQHPTTRISTSQWLEQGWQQLPAWRIDLGGEKEQMLNLQYAGRLADLQVRLEQTGWIKPLALTPATSLHWLMKNPTIRDLPILPQVNDGRNEKLLLIHTLPESKATFMALRFWPADVVLDGSTPLWVGTLSTMNIRSYLNLIHLPRTESTRNPVPLLPALSGMETHLQAVRTNHVLLIEDNSNRLP
ncbi:MAG TPA: phosphatase PAP2 family protein [Desulfobulbus sp.]|nr:phosphatase PAP2 family protein [Desulfobulbus sp.]